MPLEVLNVFELIVNQVAGDAMIAYLMILFVLLVIGVLGKLSSTFLFYWLSLYTLCYGMIFLGGLIPAIFMIISGGYLIIAGYKAIYGGQP
jgi:hypothetical protein